MINPKTTVQESLERLQKYKKMTSNAMSIASAIGMYESMLQDGRIVKYGAGYDRLQQLKTRYNRGERYFTRYKK